MPGPMLTKLLKSKIHNARVTFTNTEYEGSVTVDTDLLAAAGMLTNEACLIADVDNGNRFETYIIPGEPGSGVIGINGSAAHLTAVGHRVIIMTFGYAQPGELLSHQARVILVDDKNQLKQKIMNPTR
jgi:aspartate 1-decarboxylase